MPINPAVHVERDVAFLFGGKSDQNKPVDQLLEIKSSQEKSYNGLVRLIVLTRFFPLLFLGFQRLNKSGTKRGNQ